MSMLEPFRPFRGAQVWQGGGFTPGSLFAAGEPGDEWLAYRDFCYTRSAGGVYERVTTTGDEIARLTGRWNGINAEQLTLAARPTYAEGGGLSWASFDGVDNSLAVPVFNMTSTNKVTVCAGLRKLSDATAGFAVEFTANWFSHAGSFVLGAPGTTLPYLAASRGAENGDGDQVASIVSAVAPDTAVLFSDHDISGDRTRIRRNGGSFVTATGEKGAGNFAIATLNIGSRGGTSGHFNGHLYSLVIRGALCTTGEISDLETYVSQKSGVTL